MKRIALISCTSQKNEVSKMSQVMAKELYTSSLFKKAWHYAKDILQVDEVYILSAQHHLLNPQTYVSYYNVTLVGKKVDELKKWSKIVKQQMSDKFDLEKDTFYIFAGKNYHKYLIDADFKNVVYPYSGCKGIGYILQKLDYNITNKIII